MNTTIPADLATSIAEHYDANPNHLCIDLFYAAEGKEQPYRADVVATWWREKALVTAQTPAARMERLLRRFPYLFDEDERGPRGVAPSSKDMKESYDLLNIAVHSYGPESKAYKKALDVHARLARLCYRHGVPHRAPGAGFPASTMRHVSEGGFKCEGIFTTRLITSIENPSNTPKWNDSVNAIAQGIAADHETT